MQPGRALLTLPSEFDRATLKRQVEILLDLRATDLQTIVEWAGRHGELVEWIKSAR